MSAALNVLTDLPKRQIATYSDYWNKITPRTHEDYFRRWVFSHMSVHTTWERNVAGYEALKRLDWLDSKDRLRDLIVSARVGLYNKRTEYLWDLKTQFFGCPESFYQADDESWTQWRDRLIKRVSGLGLAKVSFALEMSFPQSCGVVCLDTHILKVFGLDPRFHYNSQAQHRKLYENAEQEWLASCQQLGYPSFMARQVYWDQLQGRSDSRYWSYVLEN